jgi:hypothetical protein
MIHEIAAATQELQVKLWTAWSDYGATGEGRTCMARIAYAMTAAEAIAGFGAAFNPYIAICADVGAGVVENEVTRLFCFRPPPLSGQGGWMEGPSWLSKVNSTSTCVD